MVAYNDTAALRIAQHTSCHDKRPPYAFRMVTKQAEADSVTKSYDKAKRPKKPKKPPSAFAVAFGLRLAAKRDARGLTGEQLAGMIGKTKNNVSHWEHAVHMPDIEVFAGLCGALDCSADEFLGREHQQLSAAALEEARAFERLPPEQQKKWRTMRLTLFGRA
jgi:transcriptional regulator with XRE-family HTH domain